MEVRQDIGKSSKLAGLQVLRAVSALLVVWSHIKFNVGVPLAALQNHPFLNTGFGSVGVDIFFVISGFVMTMTAESAGRDWQSFLLSRIARIIPLYYLVSSIFLVMLIATKSGILNSLSLRSLFDTYFFVPVLDTTEFAGTVCVNGWTLCFEMWFYLCFTALIAGCGGQKAGRRIPLILSGAVGLACAFYHYKWYLPIFLFNPIILEFCAGSLLYRARQHLNRLVVSLMLIIAVISFPFVARTESLAVHWTILSDFAAALQRAILWGTFATCCVGLTVYLDLYTRLRWPKFLLLVGDASYSLYLVSPFFLMWFVLTATAQINHLLHHDYLKLTLAARATIFVFGNVLLAILVWRYFEKPATQALKKYLLARAFKKVGMQSGENERRNH